MIVRADYGDNFYGFKLLVKKIELGRYWFKFSWRFKVNFGS